MSLVDVKGVTKRFGGLTAVSDVDLTVNAGEIHCLIGPNGAGKSTLFKLLTGQLPFHAPTPIALMFMHLNDPVPTVRTQRPDLSDAVNQVIQKATAKRPADRYTDVTTLIRELRQALASGPAVTARLTDALPNVFPATMNG